MNRNKIADLLEELASEFRKMDENDSLKNDKESPTTSEKDQVKEEWPKAISEFSIPKNDIQHKTRAEMIYHNFSDHIVGKVLDFGCGDGWLVEYLEEIGIDAVGYDINKSKKWENNTSILFNKIDLVEKSGPYDTIILYDVLDHALVSTPREIIEKVHSLLKDDGKVVVMMHPWTSRSGGHCYEWDNRSFIHLVEDSASSNSSCTQRHVKPLAFHQKTFYGLFKQEDRKVFRTELGEMETKILLPKIAKKHFEQGADLQTVKNILQISAIYYVLKKDQSTT